MDFNTTVGQPSNYPVLTRNLSCDYSTNAIQNTGTYIISTIIMYYHSFILPVHCTGQDARLILS